MKITSVSTPETADFVENLYKSIITAGTCKAPSIKIAEAAKVIENTQRFVDISLINEFAQFFDALEMDIKEVLAAASTKWNFHSYLSQLNWWTMFRKCLRILSIQSTEARI